MTTFMKSHSSLMKAIAFILIVVFMNFALGCQYYLKTQYVAGPAKDQISNYQQQNRQFIIHLEDKAWKLGTLTLQDDTIQSTLDAPYQSAFFDTISSEGKHTYKHAPPQTNVLTEAHIYTSGFTVSDSNKITLPLSNIQKVMLIDKDPNATNISWFVGFLGGALLLLLTIGTIVALTKESCPFIYAYDGTSYQFIGEIYSGSVQPQLERHDYLKLPPYQTKGAIKLRIANEVKEAQHTNLMELWMVEHPNSREVYIDKYGHCYTCQQDIAPRNAGNLDGKDILELVTRQDSLFYTSAIDKEPLPLKDGLILEFANDGANDSAKLIIHAKNSFALDYMMNKFHGMFGKAYNKWTQKQKKTPASDLIKWQREQNIPLSLYVNRAGQWEFVDYYNIAGPMAMKADVLAIPLKGNEGKTLKLKLEYGNFLWEIDRVAIDYSQQAAMSVTKVPLASAYNQKGKDLLKKLSGDDALYYDQPQIGDYAELTFKPNRQTTATTTFYLHSKGWYRILRSPKGEPQREELMKFKTPGYFNQFTNANIQQLKQPY